MTENLFSALLKYGPSARDNYLTESLAFLLGLLLKRDPTLGLGILNRLCGFPAGSRFNKPESIVISTQAQIDGGRVDMEIKEGADLLAFVEVRTQEGVEPGQLERHYILLQKSRWPQKRLVLLTPWPVASHGTTLDSRQYHHVLWRQVHHWLSLADVQDEVCRYFVESFVSFLEETPALTGQMVLDEALD